MPSKKNIFVAGMNELCRAKIENIDLADECEFHSVVSYDERMQFNPQELYQKAIQRLDRFDGPIDAIVTFWDFPLTVLTPVLAQRYHTRYASPKSIMRCEHKLWSRKLQKEVIPEFVPNFAQFDPFADDPRASIDMDYPFWIKPMISFGSHLGFRVNNDEEFHHGVRAMREEVDTFREPFEWFLQFLPDRSDYPGDGFGIAEQIIRGDQCTVEGYIINGDIRVHGVVDSFRFPDLSSFARYQYPSKLPDDIQEPMKEATRKVMKHIGVDNCGFNIEYLHDPECDRTWLLEINGRIAAPHSDLFEKVDGQSNHELVIESVLNMDSRWKPRSGRYGIAAKFFLRRFADGKVERVPPSTSIDRIRKHIPDTIVEIEVNPGQWLHDLPFQDSYSYELAGVYVGGKDEDELVKRYHQCLGDLNFTIHEPAKVPIKLQEQR